MPTWGPDYYQSLSDRFNAITDHLDERLEDVVRGRVTPAVDDLTIGTARELRAAVLFFDIRGFSARTSSPEPEDLKRVLYMLDCVIPMVMHIVHDYGGYVEKNTGDGVMAVIGASATVSDEESANAALDIAKTIFYVVQNLLNPHLVAQGVSPVAARIGIDLGPLLVARIGVPQGTARHDRNFLTAVGPAANIACRLQQMAGTNEIWVGDLVRLHAYQSRQQYFQDRTPLGWTWIYRGTAIVYKVWSYHSSWIHPTNIGLRELLPLRLS